MIAFIAPLPIGNAVRVLLSPPQGTVKARLLRKVTDDISSHDDASAAVIYEGSETSIVDTTALVNGQTYFYKEFDLSPLGAWSTSASLSATPSTDYGIFGPDALSVVRDRLAAGLKAAVLAGKLTHKNGSIPCLTAPPLYENTAWPVVTVHLQSDAPEIRGIGEEVQADDFDIDTLAWDVSEGWISRVNIQIAAWALNPDERIALRQSIKAVIIANLPIFDSFGIVNVEITQSDVEDFESYNAPVYQSITNFSCLAPSVVQSSVNTVLADVVVSGVTP